MDITWPRIKVILHVISLFQSSLYYTGTCDTLYKIVWEVNMSQRYVLNTKFCSASFSLISFFKYFFLENVFMICLRKRYAC
jgi:hypothetical protein